MSGPIRWLFLADPPGIPSNRLRRNAKPSHEYFAHVATVSKPRFLRHAIQAVTTLLDHHASGLQTQTFNSFGR